MPIWDDISQLVSTLSNRSSLPLPAPGVQDTPDPYSQAVKQARQRYPWMRRFGNIALTQGTGAGESESYMPEAEDNPKPGSYTVQLRKAAKNPSYWPALLGRESIDWLARTDPMYQQVAAQFIKSMSDDQRRQAHRAYQEDLKDFPEDKHRTYDDFMKGAQAQEYIGAYLVPESSPGWLGPNGEGQYTPEQIQMLDRLKAYLSK